MLDERPSASELLAAVADFLTEIRPTLPARQSFHARVAVNVLRVVERELAAGPAAVEAELAGLRALTGTDEDLPALNALLADRIRAGDLSIADGPVREHLIRSVLSRIAIDSPEYPSLADVGRLGHPPR